MNFSTLNPWPWTMGHSFQIKTQCGAPGCDVTHGDGDLPLLQFTVAPTLIVGASDPEFNTLAVTLQYRAKFGCTLNSHWGRLISSLWHGWVGCKTKDSSSCQSCRGMYTKSHAADTRSSIEDSSQVKGCTHNCHGHRDHPDP